MTYENPIPPDHVNVGKENAVAEFFRLAAGLAVFVIAISAVLYFGGSRAARLVPFESECALSGGSMLGLSLPEEDDDANAAVAGYLEELTARLAAAMDLPEGMTVKVHEVDTRVPNAFASLCGHIAVNRGLYDRMPSENALAIVLAHEIAHIRARDPISALGGAATLQLALALVRGDASSLAPAFAAIVQAGYSRRAESDADAAAIAAVKAVYGHAGGASGAFEALGKYQHEHGDEGPSFLATHPLTEERIRVMKDAAAGWDPGRQPLRPLVANWCD